MSGLRLVTITFPTIIKNQNRKLVGKRQSNIITNHKSNSSQGLEKNNEEQVKSNIGPVTNRRRSEVPNRPASTLANVNLQERLESDVASTINNHNKYRSNNFAEAVYESLLQNEYVFDPSWTEGRTHHIMVFRARSKEVRIILKSLNTFGIGLHFGRIDLSELTATIPAIKHPKHLVGNNNNDFEKKKNYILKMCPCFEKIFGKKAFSSSDRMTLQEIHGIVDGQTHLTCEYLTLVCVAALIASVGLRRNSATTVISSMLVSPLMGPILGITFGFAVNDKKMIRTSIRNELVGILICLAVGVAVALIEIALFKDHTPEINSMMIKGSSSMNLEMLGRSTLEDISWGLFVAIPSGVGVALAISSGGINALVGVAISAALLPPICNVGMLFAYAAEPTLEDDWNKGFFSLGLFFMNLFCICLIGYITFKIKGVNPPKDRKAFWKMQSKEIDQHLLPTTTTTERGQTMTSFSVVPPVQEKDNNGMMKKTTRKNANSWTK